MAGKEIAVKKYVVRLTSEERDRLEALVHAGKSPAQLSTRARILLKADVPQVLKQFSHSAGLKMSAQVSRAFISPVTVRSASLRRKAFSLE